MELARLLKVPLIPSDFDPKASATFWTIGITFSEKKLASSKTTGKRALPMVTFAFSN